MKRPEPTLTGIPEDLKEKNGASTRRKRSCIKGLLDTIKQCEEQEEKQEEPLQDEDDDN